LRKKLVFEWVKETKRYWKLKEELCGELAMEEAMNLSQDRLRNDDDVLYYLYFR